MVEITPQQVRAWAIEFLDRGSVRAGTAAKFREANAFINHLSSALQRKEAQASVPAPGFLRWLEECCSENEGGDLIKL